GQAAIQPCLQSWAGVVNPHIQRIDGFVRAEVRAALNANAAFAVENACQVRPLGILEVPNDAPRKWHTHLTCLQVLAQSQPMSPHFKTMRRTPREKHGEFRLGCCWIVLPQEVVFLLRIVPRAAHRLPTLFRDTYTIT